MPKELNPSLMTIETDFTVLCSVLYTSSCMNLIGWFQVMTTFEYTFFPGCGHISHRTASLSPFLFAAVFEAKVNTHSPTLPLVILLHKIHFLLLHASHRVQGKGVREAVLVRCGHPFPCSMNFNFSSSALLAEHSEGGQGDSHRGNVASSWGEHSMHTLHCSCTGPFDGLTQAVDYT